MVLAYGAIAVLRSARRARTTALATTGFAILGFVVGLNITARGGDVPDLVYHAIMLPMLIFGLVLLVRTGSTQGQR